MPRDTTAENIFVTPDCEILSSRIFSVRREVLFRAWSDPDHLKNWWGPAGFTNTFHEFDFRVGGRWRFTMHGPGKGQYENECEFVRIDAPSLIAWQRHSKPLFRVVAIFEEISPDETKLIFRMLFYTAEECRKVKAFAVGKNEENFDRLEAELAKMTSSAVVLLRQSGRAVEPGNNWYIYSCINAVISMRSTLIALLALGILASWSFAASKNRNPLLGVWVYSLSDQSGAVYVRQQLFEDNKAGIHVKSNGVLRVRQNTSFCGTPPVEYETVRGWLENAERLRHRPGISLLGRPYVQESTGDETDAGPVDPGGSRSPISDSLYQPS